jgi:F-type H+-transporting ATPase subunit a
LKILSSRSLLLTTLASLAPQALAAEESHGGGGLPKVINYYELILEHLGLGEQWVPTVGALFITVVIALMGLSYRAQVAKDGDQVAPNGRFSLRYLIEGVLEFVVGLAKDNCHEAWRSFYAFLAAIFIFILTCNLSGLIPGFEPPTVSMDTNVAIGILVFLVYNFAGLKEHGGGYIKHFLGPVAFIAPLFFCIEIVSHASRPLSLGLRLMGNIYGDHTLLGVFTQLSYLVLPALLMFFGLLVAVVQSFVFTLLSGIYISMAISHDH